MVPERARAELFRYDKTGNLHEDGAGADQRVYAKGNRLLQKGDTHYTWDRDGRLLEKRSKPIAPDAGQDSVWQYTWNAAGLLHRAESKDGTIVECAYDPFARRIEKRVYEQKSPLGAPTLQSKTRFVWDGDVLVHELREQGIATGDPVVEERTYWFEDGGFEPLAHREKRVDDVGRESGGWFHYKNDPIGTPERLVAEDGSVAAEYERRAWGQLEQRAGAKASTPIRLQGQYWDEETGLAYNRWRYYDGEGRFVSADPLGLEAQTSSFASTVNPTGWTDPLGLAGTSRRRRREREKLAAAIAADKPGANRGCSTQLTRREADRMGQEFVGPDHSRIVGRNGNLILVSGDGTRRYRSADQKAPAYDQHGQPFSRTGVQANFETGRGPGAGGAGQVATNTHIDIID